MPIALSGSAPDVPPRRRAGAAAAAAAGASSAGLVGLYLALGGAGYQPLEVADPCSARPVEELRRQSDRLIERIAFSALDGAACRLRVTREELALALADESSRAEFARTHRISERALDEAVRSGLRRAVDDAKRLGMISSLEATLLERAVGAVPVPVLMDALRTSAGKSVLETITGLLGG